MNIRGKKTILRSIEREDLEFMRSLINDPEIEHTIVGWQWPLSRKDEDEWYSGFRNSNKEMRLIIENLEGEPVGFTGLTNIDWKNASCRTTGIRISKQMQSRGFATDAYVAMLGYAFAQLRLHRIMDSALETNAASLRFLEKVGFVREGIRREHVFKNGHFCNVVALAILAEEYFTKYPEMKSYEPTKY